jgi:hypothetical protein
MTDLKTEVETGLKGRSMAEWKSIATEADVSESMVCQIGRGHYKSCPTYDKLVRIAHALRNHPREKMAPASHPQEAAA